MNTKNYTMSDIKKIDDQVDRLSYYVTLSALEAETKNLLIRDANGNDRFKNGIIVDPFNDLSIADLSNPRFSTSVDFTERSLAPAVQTFPINLKPSATSGVQLHRSTLATLTSSNNSVQVISQPFATGFRTTTSNFYAYKGEGQLLPEYDSGYDVTTNPKNITLDLSSSFESLVDTIQEFYPLTSTSSTVIAASSSTTRAGWLGGSGLGITITQDTTSTIRDTVRSLQSSTVINEVPVGDFVTDIRMTPYIRSREVKILMFGLRPNTRHYFFFNGVDVNAHVASAIVRGNINTVENPYDAIGRSNTYGTSILSNANGELYAVFLIPENTFFVGENKLDVVDVDDYDTIESASISRGTLTYRAYNFSVDKTNLTLSTRAPEFSVNTRSTTRTVTTREVTVTPLVLFNNDRRDPLAQTFFIKKGMAGNSECVYVSKIDLYFKRKSPTNGVTVMIREVLNGYPTKITLPFSKVHLTSAEVSVSEDASAVTTFAFKSPVRLDTEKEYAFVVFFFYD